MFLCTSWKLFLQCVKKKYLNTTEEKYTWNLKNPVICHYEYFFVERESVGITEKLENYEIYKNFVRRNYWEM